MTFLEILLGLTWNLSSDPPVNVFLRLHPFHEEPVEEEHWEEDHSVAEEPVIVTWEEEREDPISRSSSQTPHSADYFFENSRLWTSQLVQQQTLSLQEILDGDLGR